MNKTNYGKILKDGIITQNPVLVQVLGMCPTLAVSTALLNGLGMGAAVTMVLVFSNLFISLLRKVIDKRIRIASFIVIIAGFVTMVEMLMKAYLPSVSASLGVYIPLIVVNCIILARAEAFASRNKPLPSVVDGLACGIGFTAAICIVSAIREILGTGALLGYDFKLIPPIMIFTLAPGGLLVLGFVMAFCAWISNRRKRRAAQPAEAAAGESAEEKPALKKPVAKSESAAEPEPKPTGEGKVMEKAPLPPQKIVFVQEAAAEASPVQGEVSTKSTEGLSAADKPEPAVEAAAEIAPVIKDEEKPVILSEQSEPKDPLPAAEEPGKAGDPSSAELPRNDAAPAVEAAAEVTPVQVEVSTKSTEGLLAADKPAPEPESAADTQMTFAAVTEAEPEPVTETEPVSVSEPVHFDSEEEREAALAAAIKYFGGETAELEAPAEPAPVIQSETAEETATAVAEEEKPVILSEQSEPKDPLPAAEEPEKAGDSLSAEPPRNDAAPAPEPEPKRRSLFSRRKANDSDDDDLEPPSFMSEPVTRVRDTDRKEDRENG